MTHVNTTSGPIDTAQLGFTLMHEHLLFGYPAVEKNWPDSFDRQAALGRSVAWLTEARQAGVDTLVDVSTADNGRDVGFAAEAAAAAGVQIIVATGFWDIPRFFFGRSPEVAARFFERDITSGIQGTNIRAALIKVASDEPELRGPHDAIFRAAARTHRRTGAPITTHTDSHKHSGLDQQRLFAEEGVDLSRVIIGHSGDTQEEDYLKALLDRGSYLGMDRFGLSSVNPRPRVPTPQQRVDIVARLCRQGYASQLVLSHDATSYCAHALGPTSSYDTTADALGWWEQTFPDLKFSYIATCVVPALLEAGVSQAEVDLMMRANPRAIFERQASY